MFNSSEYLKNLELTHPDVPNRYKQKIGLINNLDPYTLKEMHLSTNPCDLPPVTNMDIVTYLVLTTSFYSNQQMKAFKSLEAYKFYEAGFVNSCGSLRTGDFFIVVGKVKHSQKMNLSALSVWIICDDNGSIRTAHCTCMAGLGEVCSHVGALLYAVESVVTTSKNTSCTDVKALWNVPGVSKVEYKEVKEMKFSRIFKYSNTPVAPPMSQDEIVKLLTGIAEAGSSAVLMRTTEPFASQIAEERNKNRSTLANPYLQLYQEEYESYSLEELQIVASGIDISIPQEDINKLKEITKKQANSEDWFLQRAGRITASNFKRVTCTSVEKPSLSLIKSICYPLTCKFSSEATEWGKKHESHAIARYQYEMNLSHENFSVDSVGLCLNSKYPCFGASPDGMANCSCCGQGCVEVKCPYTLKDQTIIEFCNSKSSCLMLYDENIYLDCKHQYYYQIQQQMALTETKFCDFVIWSPEEIFIQRIDFNEEFWISESEKSITFHKNIVMPELLGKYFSKNMHNFNIYCSCKKEDDGRPMIRCDNDDCGTKWYHMECVNLSCVPNSLWLCPSCS